MNPSAFRAWKSRLGEWVASQGAEEMRGELGASPGLCLQLAEILLSFLGQKMNNPQPQLLKIHPNICTLVLGNSWMVLGILFFTKCTSWVISPHSHQVLGMNVGWVRLKIDEDLLVWGVKTGGKQQINNRRGKGPQGRRLAKNKLEFWSQAQIFFFLCHNIS